MPAKSKKSTKKASGSSPWLSSFGSENDLLDSLLEVLKEHDITCEEIVVGLSERDIADLELSVGHRALLRRAIAALTSKEPDAVSGNITLEQDKPVPTTVPLDMAQELATIEAVFGAGADKVAHEAEVTKVASSASEDLSAQYFDVVVALKPPASTTRATERRSSGTDEFCFRWNVSTGGCPNPQSCRYKHVCIHCSQSSHKGKACTGAPTGVNPNNNKK